MNKRILIVFFLAFITLVSLFPYTVGIYGDIGAATISTFEWEATEGQYLDAIKLRDSEYYLVGASADGGADGWFYILHVWDNNGTIQQTVSDSWEFDASNSALYFSFEYLGADNYACSYFDSTVDRIIVVTITAWSSNGTLKKTLLDSQSLTYDGREGRIKHVSGDIFAIVYREGGTSPDATTDDGFLESVNITSNGQISASLGIAEFNTTKAKFPFIEVVDSDTVVITYCIDGSVGAYLCTYNISNTGVIGTRIDEWKFEVAAYYPFIYKITGNVFALAYGQGVGEDGQVVTISISNTGIITKSWIDVLEHETGSCYYQRLFPVNNLSVYGVAYCDGALDGRISTMNISSTGVIGNTRIDNFEFDAVDMRWVPAVMYCSGNYYLIVYPGTDTGASTVWDGWSCTVTITTNYATPTLSNPDPSDGSTGESLTPILAITAADLNADAMTLTWSSNSSGSWIQFGVNTSVANGTYRQHNNNFSDYNTKYWWRINITDGLNTDYEIYSFSTFTPAPDASDPSPANGSTGESIPVTTCVNISSELLPCSIDHERYEWYVPGPMSNSFFGKTFWNAQNFTVGTVGTNEDFYVTNITLELVKITGKTVGDVVVSIRSVIDGPDLCSGSIDGDLLIDDSTPPMLERINITMSPHILLSADTNYFIITRAPDAEDSSSAAWYYIFDTGAYPGGWFFTSNDAGVSWSDDTYNTSDHWFQVWGSTEIVCVTYSFWTNESGTWEQYGSGTACSNGTYCATNNFTEYNTVYYWSINLSINGNWTNETYHFTTENPTYIILLFNEDPIDGSTVIYTFSTTTLTGSNMFNMSINRSHSGGLDMNTTIWFEGSLLFTNLTWGNGSIAFDLFDYWAGSLVNGTTYHWIVNASDNWGSYSNETLDFLFTVNASFGGVVISGAPVIIEEKNMMIGLCFIFFLCGTLILRSAAKKALKKK